MVKFLTSYFYTQQVGYSEESIYRHKTKTLMSKQAFYTKKNYITFAKSNIYY
jgi:hypothetical protein